VFRKKNILSAVLFLFLSVFKTLNAQPHILFFENFSSEQGLSQNSVNCFAQDYYGYIWIGTENGLNKFDGYQITNYFEDVGRSNSLSSGTINDICIDSLNRVWLATNNGIDCFEQNKEKFYLIDFNESTTLYPRINIVFLDSKHRLWIGTHSGVRVSKKKIEDYLNLDSVEFEKFMPDEVRGNIVFIYEDLDGDIWIGADKQIFLAKQNEKLEQIKLPESFGRNKKQKVTAIAQDKKMRFWIGTEHNLYWYNKQLETFTDLSNHSFLKGLDEKISIKKILVDYKGHVFISTFGKGLLQYVENKNEFINFDHKPGNNNTLPRNYVSALFQDKSKTLLVSVIGAGFCKANLNTKNFHAYKNNNLTDKYIVRALYVQDSNTLWVGSQVYGLDRFDIAKKNFTHYPLPPFENKSDLTIKAICKYDSVNLLLGTFEHGIIVFNTKTKKGEKFKLQGADFSNIKYITDIKIDEKQNIWITSFVDGLYFYDFAKKEQKHYTAGDETGMLKGNSLLSISLYGDSAVWINSFDGGVSIFNPLTRKTRHLFKKEHKRNTLPSNTCVVNINDGNGNMWIGTSAGLCKYNLVQDSFTVFNRKQRLENEFINAIVKDSQGNLWVSTNNGISMLNVKTGTFTNFGKNDGLQNDEFNTGASCVLPDNRIVFGGLDGINIFSPDSIQFSDFTPNVNIYKFQLFNEDVKVNQKVNDEVVLKQSILATKEIVLSNFNNFISFEFSAQDYVNPKSIKYAYILEGFEKDWNITTYKFRKATYTNIDPGTYIFKVKSTNSDGILRKNTRAIKIIILPPFWKTTWFYIMTGIVVLLILFLIIYLSNRWIIIQNKRLEEIVVRRTLALEEKNIALAEKVAQINEQKIELQEKAETLMILNSDMEIFSTVVKEMRNTLIIMDAKGDFLVANRAFDEAYMPLGNIKDKYGNNIFKMPFEKHVLKIIKRCFEEKVPVQYEAEYTIIKEEKFWVHSNMTPILDEKNELKNVILIETDITEIKLREKQILELAEELYHKAEALDQKNKELEFKNRKITEQSQELQSLTENLESANKNLEDIVQKRTKDLLLAKEQAEKANQLKTMFLLNLSHEIRTPMNAICGFSELLTDEKAPQEKRKTYAQMINDNVDVLLNLIDNIMDLSKLQAKQINLHRSALDIKQKLEYIYYLYVVEDEYINDNIVFELKHRGVENITIFADENYFVKIFTNLIDNAIKYTEKGSITLQASVSEKNLIISVIDTGIGIKEEEIPFIFEHFRKVDDNIKLYRGTGLGLAIVREILDLYNWDIEVESTLGKGSAFNVKIPLS